MSPLVTILAQPGLLQQLLNEEPAKHHLSDWTTWQPWTIASIWLGFWFAVHVASYWVIARSDEDVRAIAGAVGTVSAVIWAMTLSTVLRHTPSDTAVSWVFWGGFIAAVITFLWTRFGLDSVSGQVSAGVAGVGLVFVGVSELLTRVASGIPMSVAGFVIVVGFIGLFLFLAAADRR